MLRKKAIIISVVALLVLGGLGFAGYRTFASSQQGPKHPNVLVILVDTLRYDHLSFTGYERETSPHLDKFARENLIFSYATSVSAWTPPSVASLFSGVYPSVHGHMPLKDGKGSTFTKLDDSFDTIAEILQKAGYYTAGISANPIVSEKFGLSQGFELFISPGRELGEKVNARALKVLSEMRPKDKPFFLYLHYMDPHFPYGAPAPYDAIFTGEISSTGLLKGREYDKRDYRYMSKYDGEIKYVDHQISLVFDWLRANSLYDDTVILIVSDHGEQFTERGHLGHADRLHSEENRVPFLLKANGKNGKIDVPVSLVDVFPTLLELTNINYEKPINGYSLLSDLNARQEEGVITEIVRHWNQKAFIRADGKKLLTEYPMELGLLLPGFDNIKFARLFDTVQDYAEVSPLEDRALLEQLNKQYRELYARIIKLREGHTIGETPADDATIDQLKTLGYL